MSELKPGLEAAIARIVAILSETQAASGMSKEDCDELREAFRQLIVATLRN